MNLNDFAKEIHENAKAHGWWDEPRPFDELCALMISELAEALEEARAGRPMEWHWGEMTSTKGLGDPIGGCHIHMKEGHKEGCKPEGIAVEMADCAIRIMDYLGNVECDIDSLYEEIDIADGIESTLTKTFMAVACLISEADALMKDECCLNAEENVEWYFAGALKCIRHWFKANDLDFEAIARRKHEYNKTRERLHGKLF